MGPLLNRPFASLSEGERKRVQIARALMTDPELLLLDEPAAGLDLGGREDLVQRLSELARDEAAPAIVLVTHHLEEVPPGFTHAMLLRDGGVVASGPLAEVLTEENLSETFGLPLDVTDQRRPLHRHRPPLTGPLTARGVPQLASSFSSPGCGPAPSTAWSAPARWSPSRC